MTWWESPSEPIWKKTGYAVHDSQHPGIVAIYKMRTDFDRVTSVSPVRNISFKEASSTYANESDDRSKRNKMEVAPPQEQSPTTPYAIQGQLAQNGQFQAAAYPAANYSRPLMGQ